MVPFNPKDGTHVSIVLGAMENADCWGAGRVSTAREALKDNGITTEGQAELLETCVFELGQEE